MTAFRWTLLVIGAMSLGGALLVALGEKRGQPRTTHVSQPSTAGIQGDSQANGRKLEAPRTASTSPKVERPNSEDMRADFAKATNLAAFVQRALSRPESGGRYYATMASFECFYFPESDVSEKLMKRAKDKPLPNAAKEAIDKHRARCSGMDEQFPDPGQLHRAIRDEKQGSDPLLGFVNKMRASSNSDYIKLIEEAKDFGDPYVMSDVVGRGSVQLLKKLDPQSFQTTIEEEVGKWAVVAVTCELSDNCVWGKLSLSRCLDESHCEFSDDRQMIRAEMPREHMALYDRSVAMLRRQIGMN